MALFRVEVTEGQVKTLRELVEGVLRKDIEELRQGELRRHKGGTLEEAPERVEAFYEEALDLLRSELVGLYRLFLCEEPGEAPEVAEEPTEGVVEETD